LGGGKKKKLLFIRREKDGARRLGGLGEKRVAQRPKIIGLGEM